MSKIVALSKYGFKVDSLKNDWEKVDKCLLNRAIFQNLEKGSEIEVVERNKKGFIIDFKVIELNPITNMINSLAAPIQAQIDSKARENLKEQCLNIAFRDVDAEILSFKDEMDRRIILAQKLLIKLEENNFYGW